MRVAAVPLGAVRCGAVWCGVWWCGGTVDFALLSGSVRKFPLGAGRCGVVWCGVVCGCGFPFFRPPGPPGFPFGELLGSRGPFF